MRILKMSPSHQTKEQCAYTSLRSAIIRCDLAPGDKLVIDRLSAEMGLSLISIRAAIQRLQSEGLVAINLHASAMVAQLPPEKIEEIFSLLESLERSAFRVAAQKRTDEDLQSLAELITQMDIAVAKPNPESWLTLNSTFHRCVAPITAVPLLIDFTNRTLDEWECISHYYFANITSTRLPKAQREHHKIITLLRNRHANALEKLASTHNREANRSFQSLLK